MKTSFLLLTILYFFHVKTFAQSNFFKTYDLENGSSDRGWGIIESQNSIYIATGSLCLPEFNSCFGLIKVDFTGEVLWKKIKPGYRQGGGNCLIISQDENLIAAGDHYIGEDDYEVFLMKINTTTGETIWTKYYNSYATNFARTLRELPNGDFLIFADGDTAFTSHPNLSLIKTDHEGNMIWQYDYPDEYRMSQHGDMELFPDGSIFTVCTANTWYSYDDYLVMNKFSPDGEWLWTKESFKLTFDNPEITPLPNGNMGIFIRVDTFSYEVNGTGYGPTSLIGALDSAGEFVWYELLSMEVQNELDDITTASNGDILAVGTKEDTNVWDDPLAWVVRYTQEGEEVFDKIYYFPDFGNTQALQPHFEDIIELGDNRLAVSGHITESINTDAFVFITDSDGCFEEDCSYNISTGTEDHPVWDSNFVLKAFPNPADGSTTLYASDDITMYEDVEAVVITAAGAIIKEMEWNDLYQNLDTSTLPDGLYFIQISTEKRIIATSRLVVQH